MKVFRTPGAASARSVGVIQHCLRVLVNWRPYLGPIGKHIALDDLQQAEATIRVQTRALATARAELEADAAALARLREDLVVGAIRPALSIARLRLSHIRELQSFQSPKPAAASSQFILVGYALAGAINRNRDAFTREGLPAIAATHMASLARAINISLNTAANRRALIAGHQQAIAQAIHYGVTAIQILDAALGPELIRSPVFALQWRAAHGAARGTGPAGPRPVLGAPAKAAAGGR